MNIHQKAGAFVRLGSFLKVFGDIKESEALKDPFEAELYDNIKASITEAGFINSWFTQDNVSFALASLSQMLQEASIDSFTKRYEDKLFIGHPAKTIAVVMAGNIPLVGFHDFLCVLLSGHHFNGKLSSDDPELLKAIATALIRIEPAFENMISFTTERISGFDAVIATGSNNTARYFESYFGKYSHIIRKNRNGLAVLTGNESKAALLDLGEDIFRYFGMGCRNVSKIFVPEDYDWNKFIDTMQAYEDIIHHHKYNNNYTYNKTIYILNQEPFYDTGFLLLKEDPALPSPLAVLHFEYYKELDEVQNFITMHEEGIQCVISEGPGLPNSIKPGQSQHPELWDYADGVDTMEFLLGLGGG